MTRSTLSIIGAVVCSAIVIALAYYFVVYKNGGQDWNDENRPTVPEFEFPNAKGEMVTLEDVKSDIKIINFWASWSPYSSEELKMLQRIQEEYGGKISIIALNRDHVPEEGQAFLTREGIPDNDMFVYDKNDEYFKKVSGFAVPETLFINKEDTIVHHKHGPMTYEEVKEIIESIL